MKISLGINDLYIKFSDKAEQVFKDSDSVRFLGIDNRDNSEKIIRCKTIDEVNYVNRVSFGFTEDGEEIVSWSCSCGATRGCIHMAACVKRLKDGFTIAEETVVDSSDASSEVSSEISSYDAEIIEFEKKITTDEPVENKISTEKTEEIKEESDYIWDGEIRQMEICFGRSLNTQEDVYWIPNDTEQVFHTNTGIIGTMGTGKTQFTKSLVTQLYREQLAHKNFDGQPFNVLIFDYKGDYNETKPEFVNAVDAKVYRPYCLAYNPFSLVQSGSFRPLLPVHTANTFKDTLTKSFRLGPKQQQLLLDCILEAYEHRGILADSPSTWERTAPTFEQVYEVFVEKTENKVTDSLAAAMNKLHQFRIFSSDPSKTISISQFIKGVTVLDLSGYEPDIQSFVVAITLDQFYSQMLKSGSSKVSGRYRQLRTMILVDEADNFMRDDFASLRKIMKEGREFGVGMVLSTQSLTHFVGGDDDYSRYILTWVVHNVSDLSQREVEYVFKLQPKSQEIADLYGRIKGLAKHQSILKIANSEPETIRDKAFFELD